MQLSKTFLMRGGKMNNDEIEKLWQKTLSDFLHEHSEKIKGMTEEEELRYVKENQVNEKLVKLQKDFQEKYSTQD